MTLVFYPNDCIICKKRTSLKRCSRCQMISYCGEEHQKEHWPKHKELCRVISCITKVKHLTHLYEDLRGCSLNEWTNSRIVMWDRITTIMGRELDNYESQMLHYPRCCFICYDTRQANLTNCPNCPWASFCQKHPQTSEHNKLCSQINTCHSLECDESLRLQAAGYLYESLFLFPNKLKKSPTTTKEYLNATMKFKFNEKLTNIASMLIFYPLTIFGVLQKLKIPKLTKLIVYINLRDKFNIIEQFCEIILHLVDNLQSLTILVDKCDMRKTSKLSLCPKCDKKNKTLIVQRFAEVSNFDFKTIDLALFNNINPIEEFKWSYQSFLSVKKMWPKLTCPIALTTDTDVTMKTLKNYFQAICSNMTIIYNGHNDFSSLYLYRDWEDWRVSKHSQYILIGKPTAKPVENVARKLEQNVTRKSEETVTKKSEENITKNFGCAKKPAANITKVETQILRNVEGKKISGNYIIRQFYPGVCHVCKSSNANVTCTRCKMIFYCGNEHMKENQAEHKEICRVILRMLSEKGTPHLFDKLGIKNEKAWFEAKIKFLKQAKLKLNRNLQNFEKEMFFFPKTCFVCHESDLSVLKTCKCGVSLCKIHRDNVEHKNLCDNFQMNLNFERNKKKLQDELNVSSSTLNKNHQHLPTNMNQFIDLHFKLSNGSLKGAEKNLHKTVLSDFITRPMTIIYLVEKLKIPVPDVFTIHVIGAINDEFYNVDYWNTILYWFKNLKYLFIDFIGLEINECFDDFQSKEPFNFCHSNEIKDKELSFNSVNERYDEFCEGEDFDTPDLIIGFNLNLNESNLEIADCTWKKTVKKIVELKIPFVMTAMSETQAKKDHEIFCSLLGRTINYDYLEKNPYCSLMPERNYENERICYSNSHFVAYQKFTAGKIVKKVTCSEIKNQTANGKNKNSMAKTSVTSGSKKVDVKEKGESSSLKKVEGKIEGAEKMNGEKNLKLNKNNSDSKNSQKKAVNENSHDHQGKAKNNEKLLKDNEKLQQTNKILQENLRLKEENEKLKNQILKMSLKD
ncbi:uncharacterized protein LOC122508663 [Leptopilina heterotoma]|uniref:uncharacterized protein LOC122508663 n=1 Tax=Leptopilina heterotoma TaxID=63436 RepID=UPI001CA90552|nr:uncharacterized protein LOC122508663 [Leptopilina heterotoma]